jgi:hypothetical protein
LATGPDRDGLAKTRSTVRIEDAGAVAAALAVGATCNEEDDEADDDCRDNRGSQ